ncbi:MAG: radical SAM family heme chaperone HemW [Gammaproteobacteria bacterium]|nr:radical SAM family heme chaperone HemW [Gammaproteobacteria bacterium]MCZ6537316.1 radical SAM family heme chaperone HemW [Gammaproteobacteria bacterium]MCZ6717249.1 radical SAM family heme chaperone HemW [Gammaproteobacteria bacterium]MCZ6826825.1 radical SAM family heme chaperone HemW [Gammaproteobacteria bacterium]MCZ6913049.1 radical SAM family heme chaperone HemW [Pseudomonadota bacterium]
MNTVPPLSLYVHLPWCISKCPYCDFNSHALKGNLPEHAYLASLTRDLERSADELGNRPVQSIFFGGGTPSLFSAGGLGVFLEKVARLLPLEPDIEITLEANPGTIERGAFADYRAAGINRVSLGAQSFDDEKLKALGRIHCAGETVSSVRELEKAGLANFNLDLMYGLPDQSPDQAVDDLAQAISLAPAHISHYQLTLEPNTLFAAKPPELPGHDLCWEMQQECQSTLADAGFDHYEVSAYAQAGRRCRHNLNYWTFADYLGLGAGAHGKLSDDDGVRRDWRLRHPAAYMAASDPIEGTRILTAEEKLFEFMLNALRLEHGFSTDLLWERTGLDYAFCAPPLAEAVDKGLLTIDESHCRPSEIGLNFRDNLVAIFLPDGRGNSRPARTGNGESHGFL